LADAFACADGTEPAGSVERQAGRVLGEHARLQRPYAGGLAGLDERTEQQAADSPTPVQARIPGLGCALLDSRRFARNRNGEAVEPDVWLYLAMALAVAALVLAWYFAKHVVAASPGNDRMQELMAAIREGAMAFIRREYTVVAVFVVVLAVLIMVFLDWGRPWGAIAYVFGAALSATAGFVGMRVATAANARTAEAARVGGVAKALPLAFRGGAVMGFSVAGLGLLGLALGYWFFVEVLEDVNAFQIITAIGLGGSSIALFSRVGGGIYTKAADIGADLVGKVEAGIPEDDPRNPATIADNVGDNVGDVAGMGADLFESYVGALIAPIAFAAFAFAGQGFLPQALLYPLMVATLGMGGSIVGAFFVKPGKGSLASALHRGTWVAMAITVIGVVALTPVLFGDVDGVDNSFGLVISVVAGLAIGWVIGQISEIFTSDHFKIVKEIARQSQTGPATVALAGIAEGMRSAAFSVVVTALGMLVAFWGGDLAFEGGGIYGVAIAAIGVLSTLGITVSVDAYGPIADNAGGIAEMAHLPPEVRQATDALDSLGNTTAAVAKGFAIASAAVTALALFFTYTKAVGLESINLLDIEVTVGLFIGAMFPFLFASLTIQAVGRAANQMIEEVRRQFREIPGLLEGREGVRPEYAKAVDISTVAALREMMVPGALAIALPLTVGFISVQALAGLLAGSLVTGFLLAIFMANAGGAWDNAKKFIEAGAFGGKGSEAHKAAVVGDTIGDPFKDTAGPAMNIVIKVMAIVSLIFASAFV
jgi:K(+)-stimulated pyrophosphate-energized sodium pump